MGHSWAIMKVLMQKGSVYKHTGTPLMFLNVSNFEGLNNRSNYKYTYENRETVFFLVQHW